MTTARHSPLFTLRSGQSGLGIYTTRRDVATVMTHAEAASNRDGQWMHDNYGPVIWGGSGERWDFLQLSRNGPPTGGDELRRRIRRYLSEPEAAGRLEPAGVPPRQHDEGPRPGAGGGDR